MRVRPVKRARPALPSLGAEHGFSMLLALGVMTITLLLVAAVWVAVRGDVQLSQHDLDGKRAYYAASAGMNAYLYQLNQNPSYWETCSNDTQAVTGVPGATHGEQYSFQVIPANGNTACTSDPIGSLIDTSTGTLRVEFTGYAGNPQVKRTIVAGFREDSPFDYLWYTVYEAVDSSINGYTGCNEFYRVQGGRPSACNISWKSGDVVNGPMYTEDQYLINGSPTFGRSSSDDIESEAPGTSSSAICSGNSCGSLNLQGTPIWNAPTISPPSDNSFLATDAANHGATFSGVTTITLNGSSAQVTNCPTSSCSTSSVNLNAQPIIYVSNGSGCTPSTYSPFGVTYSSSGCQGDVYVQGTYTSPVTIAAANNIIIDGNLETTQNSSGVPTGGATLGLVANEFVRVMHGVSGTCTSEGGGTNVSSQTFPNITIDAAILSIQHSFVVDNYTCGAALNTLTINGALAQYFRGAVGTFNSQSGQTQSGYTKNYTYDNRLKILLPPYLFNISNAGWHLARTTLCTPGGTNPSTAC